MRYLLIIIGVLFLIPTIVFAQGFHLRGGFEGVPEGDFLQTLRNVVNTFISIVAIQAVLPIIYGGVRYMIARGDEEAAENARYNIIVALWGLVIVGISAVLVNFVIGVFA